MNWNKQSKIYLILTLLIFCIASTFHLYVKGNPLITVERVNMIIFVCAFITFHLFTMEFTKKGGKDE